MRKKLISLLAYLGVKTYVDSDIIRKNINGRRSLSTLTSAFYDYRNMLVNLMEKNDREIQRRSDFESGDVYGLLDTIGDRLGIYKDPKGIAGYLYYKQYTYQRLRSAVTHPKENENFNESDFIKQNNHNQYVVLNQRL